MFDTIHIRLVLELVDEEDANRLSHSFCINGKLFQLIAIECRDYSRPRLDHLSFKMFKDIKSWPTCKEIILQGDFEDTWDNKDHPRRIALLFDPHTMGAVEYGKRDCLCTARLDCVEGNSVQTVPNFVQEWAEIEKQDKMWASTDRAKDYARCKIDDPKSKYSPLDAESLRKEAPSDASIDSKKSDPEEEST
jgi:uncharacterized protein (DUF736 family)